MAASGAIALYHIKDRTPEAKHYEDEIKNLETIEFFTEDLKESYDELSDCDDPDLIVIGCPHASLSEIEFLAKKLKDKKLKKSLWVCTSRCIKVWADEMDYTKIIEASGAKIVCDTCMVVSPLEELDFRCIGTNSGKAAKYLPGFCNKNVFFADIDDLVEKGLK